MTSPNPLTSAVETQLSITSSFQLWLNRQLEKNPSHGELISKIESRVVSYRERLSKSNTTHIVTHSLNESEPWTITIEPQKATGDDKTIRIPITGPGANDYSEIIAKDEQEARYITGDQYLGYIKRILQSISQAERDIITMTNLSTEIETEKSQLSRNPEDTVQSHIRLLKEYNDVKDIGQQMIGLIAENTGVRIGSLYENGDYGVTADD